ncbi:MAG: prephenate dehydrogenase [Armatimonadota bacterium]|nr:prephenate dehydrogenase [Armatimonadota bacterium]
MPRKLKQPVFDTAAIVGVGLIGGSLGMAAREFAAVRHVVGIGRTEQKLMKAKLLGAIDSYSLDIAAGVSEADLVIIATPVRTIIPTLEAAVSALKPGAVVTDVGSTKKEIVEQASRLMPKGCSFVGGHPMAGSEESGVESALPGMFVGATYVLTPTTETSLDALQKMSQFVEAIGAKIEVMSPEEHDALVALVSHLPHAVSAALLHTVVRSQYGSAEQRLAQNLESVQAFRLAAGSFRDLTRVSNSPPEIWRDICLTNAREIAKAIEVFQSILEELRTAILSNDENRVLGFFEEARQVRQAYLRSREK